ncbi:SDR family oxidoreductase [Nocardia aurantia]|uniref:Putative oxidoreductase n=1 Tax=Nocardia aurantia TaxID=2585199 RepID=A0A7K0DZU2_9NOCA|nr:SDR family oxidoreductase [Nocardia aurantia]MQY31245.1 putative oxidoreductase [Nocardia aurantia]
MSAGVLTGKVAIVTGAGGGIGRAYARGLAEAGAAVVLADIAVEAARAAAAELTRDGLVAAAVAVDVTDEDSVAAMAAAAVDEFGSADILVNNAALMAEIMGQSLVTVPLDVWHRTLAVNLTGPLLCTRAVVPHMRERGYGKIVNQSSGGAFLPSAHYGLTKLGLVSMTMSLAKELAPHGIRVNAIAPGWVNTDAGLRTVPPEVRAAIGAAIPIPFGDPEDLVGGLVYLASAASDWVTGHTLNIDGGWIART